MAICAASVAAAGEIQVLCEPGLRVYLTNPPPIQPGGRVSRAQYQLTLASPDTTTLYRVAPELERRVRALPGLVDVSTDLLLKNPQVNVEIDRDKASALGITAQQIEDSLYSRSGKAGNAC